MVSAPTLHDDDSVPTSIDTDADVICEGIGLFMNTPGQQRVC